MQKKHLAFMLVLLLGLWGCASHGNEKLRNESATSISGKLTKGVTTQAEVRAMLGSPDGSTFTDSGNEVWKYYHIKSSAKASSFIPIVGIFATGQDHKKKELTILFDQDGVVKNYTFSETESESRQGAYAR